VLGKLPWIISVEIASWDNGIRINIGPEFPGFAG